MLVLEEVDSLRDLIGQEVKALRQCEEIDQQERTRPRLDHLVFQLPPPITLFLGF